MGELLPRDELKRQMPLRLVLQQLECSVSLGSPQAKHATPVGWAYDAIKDFLTAHAAERSVRKAQLQQLLADRERAVAAEVRLAAAEWHAKGQLLVLGRERVATATARQRDAEEKAKQH